MSNNFMELGRTAYHEAGHTVVSLIFGLPFKSVSLKKGEEVSYAIQNGQKVAMLLTFNIGIAFPEERLESINKELMNGVLDIKEALSLLAGPMAEQIFLGRVDDEWHTGARIDLQAIAGCCRAAMSGSSIPEHWKEFPDMEQSMLIAIFSGANRLLRDNWTSVKAIAELLIAKKELSYAEAARIAAAKGLKTRGGKKGA